MKTCFLDTNVLLRALLNDNEIQTAQSRTYLEQAKNGRLRLIVLPWILIEVEHVLRSFYALPKETISSHLLAIIGSHYLEIPNRELCAEATHLFQTTSVDLVDALLYVSAKHADAEVLSFDKDFKKLL